MAKKAYRLFENGAIKEAIMVLNEDDLDTFWDNVLEQEAKVNKAKKQAIDNYMMKGRLLSSNRQTKEAFAAFKKAIERDSQSVKNLEEVGKFCNEINQQGWAIEIYQMALKLDLTKKQKIDFLIELAKQLTFEDQYQVAEEKYAEALELGQSLLQEDDQDIEH